MHMHMHMHMFNMCMCNMHMQCMLFAPASYAGRARRRACERRVAAAGWQVPAEPTMPRLNSQVLGF